MTTIVVDFDEQKVYADSFRTITTNETRYGFFKGVHEGDVDWVSFETGDKLRRSNSGTFLITGAGNSRSINSFARKFEDGDIPSPVDTTTEILVLVSKGASMQCVRYKGVKESGVFKTRLKWNIEVILRPAGGYLAIGSGKKYALGALYAGVSPEKAIEAASRLDAYTNSDVRVASVKGEDQ